MKRLLISTLGAALLASPILAQDLSAIETLGKSLFFDPALSFHGDQPCAFCHDPDAGFSSPHDHLNAAGSVVHGSFAERFGNRKPPSAAYAGPAPVFHHTYEDGEILFVGGAFLDGRATGHVTGTVTGDQALGPFLNPVEMGMLHEICVVQHVCATRDPAAYPVTLVDVWGDEVCAIDLPAEAIAQCGQADGTIAIDDKDLLTQVETAFHRIGMSIAAYEGSPEVNRFSSKFDAYMMGNATLTAQEQLGLDVFQNKGLCADCHAMTPGPRGEPALFTDYTYDNLGVPRNPENPWYGQHSYNPAGDAYADLGLGDYLRTDPVYASVAASQDGKHKVPTLRNVDKRVYDGAPKAFMHNGYFKTLEGVVKFYNTRDVWPRCASPLVTEADALAQECWPAPEVAANVNTDELGNLELTAEEEAALVAFMKMLTDD